MRASLQIQWLCARAGLQMWLESLQRRVGGAAPALVVVALALVVAVGSAYAAAAPRFSGQTSKGGPVVISVSRDGRVVTSAVASIESTCTDGLETFPYSFNDKRRNMLVSRSRAFKDHVVDSFTDTDGSKVDVDDYLVGRFNKRRTAVTGTWQSKLQVHAPDGSVFSCDSGPLKFSARR